MSPFLHVDDNLIKAATGRKRWRFLSPMVLSDIHVPPSLMDASAPLVAEMMFLGAEYFRLDSVDGSCNSRLAPSQRLGA
jgi:hypothetical protein